MKRLAIAIVLVIGVAGPASAQPGAPPANPDPPETGPPDPPAEPGPVPAPAGAAAQPEPITPAPDDPAQPPQPPPLPVAPAYRGPTVHPEMFRAPSGRLLPAGHIFTRSGVDTGGGLSSGLRFGLGDVAEFGLDVTDLVRARTGTDGEVDRIFPYATASFKMGVGEHALFRNQPALALGFRKSFEHEADGHSTRFAELYLVASKKLGQRSDLHLGASLWDAAIETGDQDVYLHDGDADRQLKAFGGVEVEPLPDSSILLEVSWTPEFIYGEGAADRIRLVPMFTWGVRYSVSDWIAIESGVRIPDIRDADLLGAQIFGQIKFINRALERVMKRRK